MKDSFGREIKYLRLSITELCNLRCRYCMPEDGICKKNHVDMLTAEEMIMAVRAAAQYFRITAWRLPGARSARATRAAVSRKLFPEREPPKSMM